MGGSIPSLPLYACMVWRGTTLPLLCNQVLLKIVTFTCCWGITRCSLIATILVYLKVADFCKSREIEVWVRNHTLIAVRRVRSRRVSVVLCHPFARIRTVAAKWMTIQFPVCRQEHTATWYKRPLSEGEGVDFCAKILERDMVIKWRESKERPWNNEVCEFDNKGWWFMERRNSYFCFHVEFT
jgi:hypothetical protein